MSIFTSEKLLRHEIPDNYWKKIAGGASKNHDVPTTQNPPPKVKEFIPPPPDPFPVTGYVTASEYGAKIGVKCEVTKNFSVAGTVTTDYRGVVDSGIFIIGTYDF